MNKLRRIFCPTKEERLSDLKRLLQLHREQVGLCSTCAHHIPSTMPGFVTDYGECDVQATIFTRKVCGMTAEPCPQYAEKTDVVRDITLEIQRIQQNEKE